MLQSQIKIKKFMNEKKKIRKKKKVKKVDSQTEIDLNPSHPPISKELIYQPMNAAQSASAMVPKTKIKVNTRKHRLEESNLFLTRRQLRKIILTEIYSIIKNNSLVK
jgi:hypothetical protein